VAAARSSTDYYTFVVNGDQRYAVTRRTPDGVRSIQDWTYSPSVNKGQDTNRLRVVQRGNEIAFYVNDVLLKIIQDEGAPQAARSIGLTAASFGTGTDVRFDNLRVCPPSEGPAARLAKLLDTFDDNRNGWAPQQFATVGGSTIENGQFVFEAIYSGTAKVALNWNPNIAFDALDLRIDAQIVSGTSSSRAGVLFGLQDFDNYFWFDITNDGRYHLSRLQERQLRLLSEGASPFIHSDLARNQIHLSVISNTLVVAVNDRAVLQAAIDYTPGFIGLWCGVYLPDRTLCAFDDLQAAGSPSMSKLIVYPFCNCRRTAYAGQPVQVRWTWGAQSIDYLNQFKAGTTLTVTVDGRSLAQPQQYWSVPQVVDDNAEMFWSYELPSLELGSHVVEFIVSSQEALTDGLDENRDGQLDVYGPGNIYEGYVETVVLP
jgi:hypothetical protein